MQAHLHQQIFRPLDFSYVHQLDLIDSVSQFNMQRFAIRTFFECFDKLTVEITESIHCGIIEK